MTARGPLPLLAAARVLRAEGLRSLGFRLADRLEERRRERSFTPAASAAGLPRVPILNVLATLPSARLGGLQTQLLRRLEAEARSRPVALLYPVRGGYRLEVTAGDDLRALVWEAPSPLSPVTLQDGDFERAVSWAARAVGASALHFEGQAALPLASLLALGRAGLSLLLSVHDFSLFCPRPHLYDPGAAGFCGYSRDPDRCRACLGRSWRLAAGFQGERRQIGARLLDEAVAVVFPSEFLRTRSEELFPSLDARKTRVVEPFPVARAIARGGGRAPLRHVAYVGSVQPHKGAGLLAEVAARLDRGAGEAAPRISVFGGGEPALLRRLRRLPGVEVHGYYRNGTLPELLRRREVDLALLLSIVPESYSLSLSECQAAGVPTLAFDHGAIGERLRRLGGGELVDPAGGADGVAERLRELGRNGVQPLLPAHPPSAGPAAAAIRALYRDLGLA